jgi:hypothetical protein
MINANSWGNICNGKNQGINKALQKNMNVRIQKLRGKDK